MDPTCLWIQRYRFCSLQCCPTAPAILAVASSSPRCPYRDPHPLPSAITFFPLPSATLLFLCHLPLQPPTPSSPPHHYYLSATYLPPLLCSSYVILNPFLLLPNVDPLLSPSCRCSPSPPLLAASPLLSALTATISSVA
ncbi:hypothetical protein BHE74_00024911 [Ensete ventricosum]|nr:hypothetical protein BHE74_00024911 [Ensete ventricosum]